MTKYRLAHWCGCAECGYSAENRGMVVNTAKCPNRRTGGWVVTDIAFSDPIERADAAVAALDAVNLLIENHSDMYPIDSEAFGSLNALLDFTEASVRAAIEALPKAAPAITQGDET